MRKHGLLTTALIISLGLFLTGCARRPEPLPPPPSPLPTPESALPLFPDDPATPAATPLPTTPPAAVPETKGNQPLPTSTPRAKEVVTPTPLPYSVSASTIEVNLNPSQTQTFPITLTNNSARKVSYAVRAEQKPSDTFPVGINSSHETTGHLDANGQARFNLTVRGTPAASTFTTTVLVNFAYNGRVQSSQKIQVTVRTFVADPITVSTNTDADHRPDPKATITYRKNQAFPIRLQNRYSRPIRWEADITSPAVRGHLMNLPQTSGFIAAGADAYTNIHFTTADLGQVTLVHVQFTFKTEDGTLLDSKTLELTINQ
jgi:hypothetical protein